jgi:hypothetical protein
MNPEKATLNLIRAEIRSLDAQIRVLRKIAKLTAEANDVACAQLFAAENDKKDLLRRAKELQA